MVLACLAALSSCRTGGNALVVDDIPPDTLWDTLRPATVKPSPRPGPVMVDPRDGSQIPTDSIGDMVWTSRNLSYVPPGLVPRPCPGGSIEGCVGFGRLYSWGEAMGKDSSLSDVCDLRIDSTGICPVGWHVPSLEEWDRLATLMGGWERAGMHAKLPDGWLITMDSTARGTDSAGFAGLPAGFESNGIAQGFGSDAGFWSRTDTMNTGFNSCVASWAVFLNADSKAMRSQLLTRKTALSVRCVKNH